MRDIVALPCPRCGKHPIEWHSHTASFVYCDDHGTDELNGSSYFGVDAARRDWNEAVLDYEAEHKP